MEVALVKLLEDLEEVYPESIKVSELLEEYPNHLIDEAYQINLIVKDKEKIDKDPQFEIHYRIGIEGTQLLNQIRTKEVIEKFNKSSDRLSNRIIWLTGVLISFTAVLLLLSYLTYIKL